MCKLFNLLRKNRNGEVPIMSSKKIIIERFCYAPEGTFGMLYFDGFKAFTVERAWKNNEPYVSCIPDGEYVAKWYDSPRFGRTLAVVGGTVSLFPSPNHDRSAILFHLGNWPRNFNGCIGLGRAFTCINGEMGVTSSGVITDEFLELATGLDNIPLIIKQSQGAV